MTLNIIFAIVGVVLILIGSFIKSSSKRSNAKSVISMILISIGALFLLYSAAQFVLGTLEGWHEYSDFFSYMGVPGNLS